MPTFDTLIAQVRQQLMGYSQDQLSVSELSVSMASGDTTFTVTGDTVSNVSRGVAEIDDELVLIKSYDQSSGVVTVMGGVNGRGYEGTVAASHSAHALVTSSPPFPRTRIKEAVNQAITGVYPHLVVFATTEITNLSVVYEYQMPADAMDVWYVVDQNIGPSKMWSQAPNWKFNPKANTTDFPTGKSIQLFDAVTPGRAMRVVYSKRPSTLVNGSDDFATTTGFEDRITDLVMYGALKRLLPAYEASRLQQQAIETTERAPLVPPTSAAKAVAMYNQLYQERLQEERDRMFQEIPNFAFTQGG